jgi:hypothetical protein
MRTSFCTYFMRTPNTLSAVARTTTDAVAPTKSRPLTTVFFCGYLQKYHLHRENSGFTSMARENWSTCSVSHCRNASTNEARKWLPTRYLQGYKQCENWDFLRCVWKLLNLVNTLQQIPYLYLAPHKVIMPRIFVQNVWWSCIFIFCLFDESISSSNYRALNFIVTSR